MCIHCMQKLNKSSWNVKLQFKKKVYKYSDTSANEDNSFRNHIR